jgi:hypothetical protein
MLKGKTGSAIRLMMGGILSWLVIGAIVYLVPIQK